MAVKGRKRARAGILTKLLLLVLLVALGWQLYHLHSRIQDAEAEKASLAAEVQKQQQANDALSDEIKNGSSQEQLQKVARDELGLVSPGEKIFYDVSN